MFSRFPRPRQPLRAGARMRGAGAAGARGIRGRAAGEGCGGGADQNGETAPGFGIFGIFDNGIWGPRGLENGIGDPRSSGSGQQRLCPSPARAGPPVPARCLDSGWECYPKKSFSLKY